MVCLAYGFTPMALDMLLSDIDPDVGSTANPGRKIISRRIPVDVIEREAEFEILADVPGVQKDAIHLDIDKDTLVLSVSGPGDAQATPAAPATDEEAPRATASGAPAQPPAAAEGGEKPEAAEAPAQPKVLRCERAQRFAKRALKLPQTADLGAARAEVEAGVLTVVVPKKAPPSPKRIIIA